MVRRARTVIPGYVHHIMQRGNKGQDLFFSDEDFTLYLSLLHEFSRKHGLAVWAYCLMPDHVRLIAVPAREDALQFTVRDTHSAYAMHQIDHGGSAGAIWHDRYASCILDDLLVLSAARLVESLPARAGLAPVSELYRWSSAAAHCGMRVDYMLSGSFPPPGAIDDWSAWLRGAGEEEALDARLLQQTRTGRPCGTRDFIDTLEARTGRILRPQRRGPKPKWDVRQNVETSVPDST